MVERQVRTSSPEETEALAAAFGRRLPWGSVVALYGELGAGKTVFARGLARGLGVAEAVSSPTFTLVKEYPLAQGRWLYHLDLYRVDNSDAALAFGVDEYIFCPDADTLLEWPERVEDLLPPGARRIHIRRDGEDFRLISGTDGDGT